MCQSLRCDPGEELCVSVDLVDRTYQLKEVACESLEEKLVQSQPCVLTAR